MYRWKLFRDVLTGVSCAALIALHTGICCASEEQHPHQLYILFDDALLLDGYAEKYADEPLDTLIAIITDPTLSPHETAAAVRVFKERFSREAFAREKALIEKTLLRQLKQADSSFVAVEIMHTLLIMDRYKYFASMIPALIQELDHYNQAVNEMTYAAINDIIESGHNRPREARIVFNTLRRALFLSRRKISDMREPDARLKQKFKLVRWSIKILGSQELKRLPPEAIRLL